jgi:hypothetical protein
MLALKFFVIAIRSRVGLVVLEFCWVDVRNLGLWIASWMTLPRVAALLVIFVLRRRHGSLLEHVLTSKTRNRMQGTRHSREPSIPMEAAIYPTCSVCGQPQIPFEWRRPASAGFLFERRPCRAMWRVFQPERTWRSRLAAMTETARFNILRLRYKMALDAAKAVAVRNAKILSNGGELSEQERAEEVRAAEELQHASDQMMASTSRLGQ